MGLVKVSPTATLSLRTKSTKISSILSRIFKGQLWTSSEQHAVFSEAECSSCDNPCDRHEQLPEYLANKIEGGDMMNSFKPYSRHVLVKVGSGDRWNPSVDETPNSIIERLVKTLPSPKGSRTMITAYCDVNGDVVDETSDCATVMVMPDGLVFPTLAQSQLEEFATWFASKGPIPQGLLANAPQHSTHIFVCTHRKRDKRCGVIGPMLMDEFQRQLKDRDLLDKVAINGVSHIGGTRLNVGHKFAGNLIIYHTSQDGTRVADWYGRVKTCHVGPIVEETVLKGKVFKSLWRGRMDAGMGAATKATDPGW